MKAVHSPRWADLPPLAKNVLTCMAITARDHPREEDGIEVQPANYYYRGHEHIGVSEFATSKEDPEWPAVQQKITRAIRQLEEAGALRTVQPAANGRKAIYELLPPM